MTSAGVGTLLIKYKVAHINPYPEAKVLESLHLFDQNCREATKLTQGLATLFRSRMRRHGFWTSMCARIRYYFMALHQAVNAVAPSGIRRTQQNLTPRRAGTDFGSC